MNLFAHLVLSVLLLFAFVQHSHAFCFDEAARRQKIDPALLYAIARAESSLRADAVNRSHFTSTKTVDIGLMQINSGWLPKLSRFGISERDLYDPCTNVHVGAWILGQTMDRHGNTWTAVGAYNTACTQLKGKACDESRARYVWRVYHRLPNRPAKDSR